MKTRRKPSMQLYEARKVVLALLRHNACPQNTMHGILDRQTVQALRVMLERSVTEIANQFPCDTSSRRKR